MVAQQVNNDDLVGACFWHCFGLELEFVDIENDH